MNYDGDVACSALNRAMHARLRNLECSPSKHKTFKYSIYKMSAQPTLYKCYTNVLCLLGCQVIRLAILQRFSYAAVPFIRSFVCSFLHSLVPSRIHLFIRSFNIFKMLKFLGLHQTHIK